MKNWKELNKEGLNCVTKMQEADERLIDTIEEFIFNKGVNIGDEDDLVMLAMVGALVKAYRSEHALLAEMYGKLEKLEQDIKSE